MRRSTFNDHMATCNSAGACFVTNDAPFPFNGSVSVRILNVATGASANQSRVTVALPTGPKVTHWFCAQDLPNASHYTGTGSGANQEGLSDDEAAPAASPPVAQQAAVPGSSADGWTMVLVSDNGFPEHGSVAFNQEAAAVTTEAECLATCLANVSTCKAVTWVPRPKDPCTHYQDIAGTIVKPSPGCHYYRLTRDDNAPYTVIPALPIDRDTINKTLVGKTASVGGCEAACSADPKCLGFTKYNHAGPKGSWRNNCWLYDSVPSLVANTDASWYQKPGTKPIPGPKPKPPPPPHPPPHPPAPPPKPPAPYPEPAQLNCTSWAQTSGWQKAGCNTIGGNCVLLVDVYGVVYGSDPSASSPVSWSVLPFQPPKHMELAPANVTWHVGQPASDGSHVTITLTSDSPALYVVLTTAAQGRFSDSAILLEGGVTAAREVDFLPWDGPLDATKVALLRSTLRVEHLAENLLVGSR